MTTVVDPHIIDSTVEAVVARLRAMGGNRTHTIVPHGEEWLVDGRALTDEQLQEYVRVLAERWWERDDLGRGDLPRISTVLGLS